MTLRNEIQLLKDRLKRERTLLGKLESGEMQWSPRSPNREHDTEERIKELKASIEKGEVALRELEAVARQQR
jgi:anti-sigma28 factor (negative regulator of flagellin synthesis)